MAKNRMKYKNKDRFKLSSKDMSFSEKVENLWYHYKWWILLGAFLGVAAIVCIVEFFNPTLTDYNIVFVTDETYDYNQMDYLTDCLTEYGRDVNGDGEITYKISYLSKNKSNTDPNAYIGETVTVNQEIEKITSFIFIIDDYGFEQYKDDKVFGNKEGEGFEDIGKNLRETKLEYQALSAGFADDIRIVLREYPGEKEKDARAYKELYNAVTAK